MLHSVVSKKGTVVYAMANQNSRMESIRTIIIKIIRLDEPEFRFALERFKMCVCSNSPATFTVFVVTAFTWLFCVCVCVCVCVCACACVRS